MYRFNRDIVAATLITWIKDWFDKNGKYGNFRTRIFRKRGV